MHPPGSHLGCKLSHWVMSPGGSARILWSKAFRFDRCDPIWRGRLRGASSREPLSLTLTSGSEFLPVHGLSIYFFLFFADALRLHYQLAKCTWKMFSRESEALGNHQSLLPEDVTGEVIRAIELLPTKKDPRRAPAEPILEPHYKLVSIVHKMVMSEDLEV